MIIFNRFSAKYLSKLINYIKAFSKKLSRVKTVLAFLLLSNVALSSDVLHKISLDSNPLTSGGEAIVNGNLIFGDSNVNILATDGTLSNTRDISGDNEVRYIFGGETIYNNNSAFFNFADYMLWQTDGLSVNKIKDVEIDLNFVSQDDDIYVKTRYWDKLLIISEDATQEINISQFDDIGDLDTLCRFDDNHFITISEDRFLYSRSVSAINQIELHEFDNEQWFRYLKFAFKFEGNCYYSYNEDRNEFYPSKTYFKVKSDLEIKRISTTTDDTTRYFWENAFVFNNTVYFSRSGFGLYSLENNSHEPQIVEEFAAIIGSFSTLISVVQGKHFLYAEILNTLGGGRPEDRTKLTILDKDFNVLDSINAYKFSGQIAVSGNKEFFHLNSDVDQLGIVNENGKVTLLSAPHIDISKVVSDDVNTFIFAHDTSANYEFLNSYKMSLYRYSDKPLISKQLTGLWTSPDWQGQGLTIHTGKRPDNTEYLFVSFLIYRDGEAFWLAGSAEIDLGQAQVTIDLSEFKGASFLPNQTNSQVEQILFGTLTINPTGCNQIDTTVKLLNNDEIDITMTRVLDTTHDKICVD
jgi:hypothetical protein